MQAPTLHRFTADEYHRMAELGFLAPDARVELIEGQIHDMSPIGPNHGAVVMQLNEILSDQRKKRWIVSVQHSVRLDNHSELEPDVVLLKRAPDFYRSRLPETDDVLLLIEVADSSLNFDRRKKLPVYARAGIPEVWIVDLQESAIEVYREPHFTGYEQKTICREGDKASPTAFPDVKVDVGELLM